MQQSETEYWARKAFALYGAVEAREEFIGWDDLDSAQAILESPTDSHPTIIDGGKFKEPAN